MVKNNITSIRVTRETKEVLDSIKIHPRETHEDIIRRLIKKAGDTSNIIPLPKGRGF